MENCNPTYLGCPQTVAFSTQPLTNPNRLAWAQDPAIANNCFSAGPMPGGNFSFGIYSLAVPLVTNNIPVNKILLPLFWGVMTMRYTNLLLGETAPLHELVVLSPCFSCNAISINYERVQKLR